MKIALLLPTLLLACSIQAQSQKQMASFTIAVQDLNNRSFFSKHPEITSVTVRYRFDEPGSVSVYKLKENGNEYLAQDLYLNFEGDCYTIAKSYPSLILPSKPNLNMWLFSGFKRPRDSTTFFEIYTKIKRDSLIHHVTYFLLNKGEIHEEKYDWNHSGMPLWRYPDSVINRRNKYALHPRLKGTDPVLQKKLNMSYRKWKPIQVLDSTLVFRASLDENNRLTNLILGVGRPSGFSEMVSHFIQEEAAEWWPSGTVGVGGYRGAPKIFVRLNKDNTITFSTL